MAGTEGKVGTSGCENHIVQHAEHNVQGPPTHPPAHPPTHGAVFFGLRVAEPHEGGRVQVDHIGKAMQAAWRGRRGTLVQGLL